MRKGRRERIEKESRERIEKESRERIEIQNLTQFGIIGTGKQKL